MHVGQPLDYVATLSILVLGGLLADRVSDQLSAACIIRHCHTEKKQWQKLGNAAEM